MTSNTYSSLWFQLFMPLQAAWTHHDVAFLLRQLPLPRYRRVLDLCCGYGRHAIRLAAQGYTVTGLDRDAAAIEEARRLTAAEGQDVTYLIGDMRETGALPDAFDAIINMWQSLSYFDDETNAALLRQIAAKLAPEGRFIVDLYNRDHFERNQGDKIQQINDITVETHGYMEGNRWHSVLSYRDTRGARGGDHMEWQVYTPDEFRDLAVACGFTPLVTCTLADANIAPSPDIARMQFVLEKR